MCVWGGTIYFKMENERACEWVCLISVQTEGVCVCSYFMHLECSWQRATGTLTTQEWKASRSVWLGFVQSQRERLPRLHRVITAPTHTHTHTQLKSSIQPSCTFTTKHFLEHGYTHSLIPNNFPSGSPWVNDHINIQCDHPHSAAGRRHSNSFHMRRG